MNNLEKKEENTKEIKAEIIEVTEDNTANSTILYFLNTCGIICSSMTELHGTVVMRETLLSDAIYDKLKPDLYKLKPILSSTSYTSVHKDADKSQKWPLINLVRQILRKYNYEFVPKRVCDGYTKDGIKKFKRQFEVRGFPLQTP